MSSCRGGFGAWGGVPEDTAGLCPRKTAQTHPLGPKGPPLAAFQTHPWVFFPFYFSFPALPEAPSLAETALQSVRKLHVDTWILVLKRCQGENELEDERVIKRETPERELSEAPHSFATQNPEYRGRFSLDTMIEAVTKIPSSVLKVWSKVRWIFNSEVPTQSILRLSFNHEITSSYNPSNLHRPNVITL